MSGVLRFAGGLAVAVALFALALTPIRAVELPDVGACAVGESGLYQIREVIEVPGVTADTLQNAAREWIARSFNDGQAVIQLDVPGQVIGKGSGG